MLQENQQEHNDENLRIPLEQQLVVEQPIAPPELEAVQDQQQEQHVDQDQVNQQIPEVQVIDEMDEEGIDALMADAHDESYEQQDERARVE